jgi:hypothetical protein
MKAWKIQKFFGDIVYDLRSRGLLPLAALLAVGIVAVPILIGRSGSDSPAPVPALDSEAVSAPENEPAVLTYAPGVRDYRKRLEALQEKDPFKQQFTSSGSAATLGGGGDVTTTLGGTSGASVGGGSASGSASVGGGGTESVDYGGSPGSDGGGGSKPVHHRPPNVIVKTKYLSYRMDAAFGEVGSMKPRRDVEPLSFLAGEDLPVLVFLGIGGDGSKAMFLVSSDVSAADGQGTCVPNSSSPCYLLVLRTGQVEDLTYGPNGKTYRLKVTAIRRSSAG